MTVGHRNDDLMITRQDIEDMGYEYYTNKEPVTNNLMGMVQEFSRVMGQVPNSALYLRLIEEEYEEFMEEAKYGHVSKAGDIDELKELSDLVYVCFGYALAMGWDLAEAVNRVHKNNLARCIQPDGSVQRREDGKIIKNPNAPKVDLGDLV